MKNLQGGIKKSKKEIEKCEFGGLIIDRSKSQQEIDARVDQLAGGFQKTERPEETPELERDGDQYSEGLGDVSPGNANLDRPIPQMFAWGRTAPKRKAEKKQTPWKLN